MSIVNMESPVSSALTAMQGSAALHFASSTLLRQHHARRPKAPIGRKRVIDVLHGSVEGEGSGFVTQKKNKKPSMTESK